MLMIDLHSHILPQLCDGSQDLETSLAMARIAVADGVTHLACTPHIYPGVYPNSSSTIFPAMQALQAELDARKIPLQLVAGADVHMVHDVVEGLQSGRIPTLNGSRYFLLEPAHRIPVPRFLEQIEAILEASYVPVITHPERLLWLEDNYRDFIEAVRMGAWLQVTAGAVAGMFGRIACRCAQRLLEDGVVHILASDAHGVECRPPVLSEGVEAAIRILGDENEVMRMVLERPRVILDNAGPKRVPLPIEASGQMPAYMGYQLKKGWFGHVVH
ncbi:PHP domain protein [Thiothrix nivea DSM 5205]|uniref:protein-tyrosine-phosphatase n=2 Tax=Thiothrix nivea TaxID=1031 RepID=A0A656HLS6_THINJ|nr:PHP domain protein [Thiothrix nivea DSM 5205]